MSIKQLFYSSIFRQVIPVVKIIKNIKYKTSKTHIITFDTLNDNDKQYIENKLNNDNIETYKLNLKYSYETQTYNGIIETTYKKKQSNNELDYYIEMANNYAFKN